MAGMRRLCHVCDNLWLHVDKIAQAKCLTDFNMLTFLFGKLHKPSKKKYDLDFI